VQVEQQTSETDVLTTCERRLRESLPPGWTLTAHSEVRRDGRILDAFLTIDSPVDEAVTFAVETKKHLNPKSLLAAIEQLLLTIGTNASTELPLIATGYLSPRSREMLLARNVNWIDTTGNIRIVAKRPGLFVERTGAQSDPWRRDEPLQSLRGAGAGRAMRALIDSRPPYGVRELALLTGASAATLSRVINLLEREAIVERDPRGGIATIDWPAAIRRWSQDYPGIRSKSLRTFLEPRGFGSLSKNLASADFTYAVTSSFAAKSFAPVAPTQLAVIYVTDISRAQAELGLRSIEVGANVAFAVPFDSVAFDRTIRRDGLTIAALSQVVVDLLTGPGREPAEGESLIEWMKENEDVWRS
jgi:hypothetical protein